MRTAWMLVLLTAGCSCQSITTTTSAKAELLVCPGVWCRGAEVLNTTEIKMSAKPPMAERDGDIQAGPLPKSPKHGDKWASRYGIVWTWCDEWNSDLHRNWRVASKDDIKPAPSIMCPCGSVSFMIGYGSYECIGTCAECGKLHSLYSG